MQRTYETDRLLLRVLDGSHAGAVLEYLSRNRQFLEEWEPWKPEDFYTPSYQASQLDKELDIMRQGAMFKLWICKKDDPDGIIGSVSFNNIVRGSFLSCHLGYRLDEREINRGYMTEAVARGIGIMFGEYGLHRIEANIMPKNLRSMRVVQKLGFVEEGLAKGYLKINGRWEDHVHMVLFNDAV